MSRRPNLVRRMALAYMEYVDSAAEKIARVLQRQPPKSASTVAAVVNGAIPSATTAASSSPSASSLAPACFSATSALHRHNLLRNVAHYLGYSKQPQSRAIFSLQPGDSADAFRLLDDRPFGGRTEASARIVERVREDGERVLVLLYEGVLHPLPPFQSRGSRWMEDVVRPPPPVADPSAASYSNAASPVGPTGLSTPAGMLSGFSSITSPTYRFPDLNLTPYTHLAFRLRTDGRPYTLSIRCHERLPLVYQARIPPHSAERPTHWKEIRLDHFLTTFQGQMQTLQFSLPRARIANWGLSVTGPPGPFAIEIERVEARRGLAEYEKAGMKEDERVWREEEERRSRGERFLWWLDDSERAVLERFGKQQSAGEKREVDRSMDVVVRREGEVEREGGAEVDEDEATRLAREEAAKQHQSQPQRQQQQQG